MSKKANKRLVSFSPDIDGEPKALLDFIIDDGRKPGGGSHLKQIERNFACRLVKRAHSRVVRFFHRVSFDMANALRSRPPRRKIRRQPQPPPPQQPASARRVSASMTPQRFIPSRDSHQSEAVEDCIKFLNSSSRREVMLEDSSANIQSLLHNQQYCY